MDAVKPDWWASPGSATKPTPPGEIEDRVALRLKRQDPPRIWSVMPHVTIQVVPFARSGRAGESGSFSILRFVNRDLPDVVYMYTPPRKAPP